MCLVKRFIKNCKIGRCDQGGESGRMNFTQEEKQESIESLIRIEQGIHYNDELKALKKDGSVTSRSNVVSLAPFLDKKGLLRIRGRLANADLEYDQKYPCLLPGNSHLALLICRFEHIKMLHGGYRMIAVRVREYLWITKLKWLCHKITSRCVICIRHRGQPMEQLMGNYPKERITPEMAFEVCGVDYAGPFEVIPDLTRSRVVLKKCMLYLCV